MKRKSVLDAFALLAYLKKEGGHARVRDLLAAEGAVVLVNSINLGEVFYVTARERGLPAADYVLNVILPSLPLTVVGNTLEEVIEAARLKAVHGLAFADCFAAATAIRVRAALVTGDAEFKKLGKALTIDWVG